MKGTLTISDELLKELKIRESEIKKDYPDYDMLETFAPWMISGNEEEYHPSEEVYIGYDFNFPSFMFDQTKDRNQDFYEFFPEFSDSLINENGKFKNNENYLGRPYGLCDNYEQALEYTEKYFKTEKAKFILWMCPVFWQPENAGKEGGFRPYKWGKYVGKYTDLINSYEYFDDIPEFPQDFQGYIFSFHVIRTE
jgi:hypothetical protein